MNNTTKQNLIDSIVLNEIKNCYYLDSNEIVEMLNPLCEESCDLDEILDFVYNSKRYNFVLKQNGDGYILSTKTRDFIAFFEDVEISDNDPVWLDYVYHNNESKMLRDVYEEVK